MDELKNTAEYKELLRLKRLKALKMEEETDRNIVNVKVGRPLSAKTVCLRTFHSCYFLLRAEFY